MKKRITVLGAGSWGTAISQSLCENGHQVTLWARNTDSLKNMELTKENTKYLPGVKLHSEICFEPDLKKALGQAEFVIYSVPSQQFRRVFTDSCPLLRDDVIVINLAKGIEIGSLKRLSEIAKEIKPEVNYVCLSGPSHAEEVAIGLPTTLVATSDHLDPAKKVQDVVMTDKLRVYTQTDLIGVELGGATKNVIALAAGINDGLGFGDNAKAALITRGMAEISRLAIALGADKETLSGLCGMGDLIVTCTSVHSRNWKCGYLIGTGVKPEKAAEQVGMVVEGIYTCEACLSLANKYKVEMPIIQYVYDCIHSNIDPKIGAIQLMTRDKKHE